MTPFLSVIIPVYKVEKYLNQCVDSILAQTFQNFEVILVDDGSPDGSGKICDEYEKKDPRVRVIHKENGGLSSARNVGLEKAVGEYIFFLDSDDYLNCNTAFEKMEAICRKQSCDFVLFKSIKGYIAEDRFVDWYGDYDLSIFENGDNLSVFRYMISQNKQLACAWNKIVRRSLLVENQITFEEGVISEDVEWNARLYCAATKICAINEAFHVYRQARADSITATHSEKHVWDIYHVIGRLISFAEQSNSEAKELILAFAAFEYAVLLVNISAFSDVGHFAEIKKTAWVLKHATDKKTRAVSIAYRLLGYKNTLKLMKRIRS